VGKSRHSNAEDDPPKSVVLRGTAWLIDEDETDIIVAAYIASDGGCMDMVAIPKSAIEKRRNLRSHSSSGTQEQVSSACTQSPQ